MPEFTESEYNLSEITVHFYGEKFEEFDRKLRALLDKYDVGVTRREILKSVGTIRVGEIITNGGIHLRVKRLEEINKNGE